MTFIAQMGLAFGLSADAFAVNVGRGACCRECEFRDAAETGLVFGAVEATMVFAGYLSASHFAGLVTGLDHWIALLLLAGVGGHMIYEGLTKPPARPAPTAHDERTAPRTLLMAMGTSVDGAAVGVSLAFLTTPVWLSVVLVGMTSAAMSALGFLIGPRVGAMLGRRAEVIGGTLLVGIGAAIFTSHTGMV